MRNKKLKNLLIFTSTFYILHAIFIRTVYAVCPVCTVAVGAGLGLSRYFGIDDLITGIWVGGLIISLSLWTSEWIQKKDLKYLKRYNNTTIKVTSFLFWSLLTYYPLLLTGIIGHPYNTLLGIDKLIFGSVVGTFSFLIGISADQRIRKAKGKQLFNYQKVVFPVASLVLASILVYYYGGHLK